MKLKLEIGFTVHIQSKLLQLSFVMGASSDLGQHSSKTHKKSCLGLEESRLSHYDIQHSHMSTTTQYNCDRK